MPDTNLYTLKNTHNKTETEFNPCRQITKCCHNKLPITERKITFTLRLQYIVFISLFGNYKFHQIFNFVS